MLGDDDRRMIRQHDAARADPDLIRTGSHVGHNKRSRRTGDTGHVMVFGHPDAVVIPVLRMRREVTRIVHGGAGISAFGHSDKVKNG